MRTLQRGLVRVAAAAVAVVGWGAVIVMPTGASAAIVTTPVALSPGDQYRLAFVTKTTLDATSSDIAVYNTFVTTAANSQPELLALGATWRVIGSTDTIDARDNTGTNPSSTGFPIYLLDGTTKIADNNADLWDSTLDFPLNIFVDGTPTPRKLVWTGSNSGGFVSLYTATLGDAGAVVSNAGHTFYTSGGWLYLFQELKGAPRYFYALSSPLAVAPLPVTFSPWLILLFLIFLLIFLGLVADKRRQN